jgi:ornithine carbamoyltransferase
VNLTITTRPEDAVKDSDCIMTDKWVSMNDNVNKKLKKKDLKPYQVNKRLMNKAHPDVIFMHCLPVGRGEEVADDVIDGKQSVVWRQALNRVHAQKSIIKWCLD